MTQAVPQKTNEALANLLVYHERVADQNMWDAIRSSVLLMTANPENQDWSWKERVINAASLDDVQVNWTLRSLFFSRVISNSRFVVNEMPWFSEDEYLQNVKSDWDAFTASGHGFDLEWDSLEKLVIEDDILSNIRRNNVSDFREPNNFSQKTAMWLFTQANLFQSEESLNKLLSVAVESNSVALVEWAFAHGASADLMVKKHRPDYMIPVAALSPSVKVLELFIENGLNSSLKTEKEENISSFIQTRSEYVFPFVKGERQKLIKSALQMEAKNVENPQANLWNLIKKSDKVGDAVAAVRSLKGVELFKDGHGRHIIQYALLQSPEAVSALLNMNKKMGALLYTPDEKGRSTKSYYLASLPAQSHTGSTGATYAFNTFNEGELKKCWLDAFEILKEQSVPMNGLFTSRVETLFETFEKTQFIDFIEELTKENPSFYKECLDWQVSCSKGNNELQRRHGSESFSYGNRNALYRFAGYSNYGDISPLWEKWVSLEEKPKDESEGIFRVQVALSLLKMGAGYSPVFNPENLREKGAVIEQGLSKYMVENISPDTFNKITDKMSRKELLPSDAEPGFFAKSEWWRNLGAQIERNHLLERQKSVTNKKSIALDGAL